MNITDRSNSCLQIAAQYNPPGTLYTPPGLSLSQHYFQPTTLTVSSDSSLFTTNNHPMKTTSRYATTAAGITYYFDTLEEALASAEASAHTLAQDVFVFEAIKKVSPKREVTVTDLRKAK